MTLSKLAFRNAMMAWLLAAAVVPFASAAEDAAPPPTVSDDSEAGWTPFQADEDEALLLARTYLAALDEGRFDDAYVMQTPAMDALEPRSASNGFQRAFYDEAGAVVSRRITAVTWTHHGDGSTNVKSL